MEEMYEVLKFIEHGAHCRQSMDCVQGTLLISCLRGNPEIKKNILFEWFRQLALCLEQFQRCRNGQNYRYLSPYSIVVSEEEGLLLLDLDSPENEFAIKMMQHRAVRTRFVLPVRSGNGETAACADLFAMGRIIQLMLACVRVFPSMTRREEIRLFRLTERCTAASGKRYTDFRQLIKDLPENSVQSGNRSRFEVSEQAYLGKRSPWSYAGWKKNGTLALAGLLLFTLIGAATARFFYAESKEKLPAGPIPEEVEQETMVDTGQQASGEEERADDIWTGSEEEKVFYMEMAEKAVQAWMLENNTMGNQSVITYGCELQRSILAALAAVYEREEMTEEALLTYERLIETEERTEKIESAGIKKMTLEAERGQYAQALLTGDTVLEKIGSSQQVESLMNEYRNQQSGEGEKDEENEENEEKIQETQE